MIKLRGFLFTVAMIFAFASVGSAQTRTQPGCYTAPAMSATGRLLLYQNPSTAPPIQMDISYSTTGTPAGVSILIETGNALAGTVAPATKIGALTNTTADTFQEASGGELYWYANLGTLSGGTNPTVVVRFCARAVNTIVSTSLVASTSVTGSGAMVLANTPTLITPIIGVATGTSLDLTGGLDSGVAGTTVGTLALHNATSGTLTISPGAGALGTVTMTAPNMGAASALLATTLTTNAPDAANSITGISNGLLFEGATADTSELTLSPVDPTGDATISIPATGTTAAALVVSSLTTNTFDAANSVTGASNALVMEGATADGFEASITLTDPTADVVVTIPNAAVSGAFRMGQVEVSFVLDTAAAPTATDAVFFIATRSYLIMECSQVHAVAAGGASTLQVVKDTTTAAPGAGTNLLTAAFDLNATANTVQAKATADFVSAAARAMVAGDRISVDFADAIQATIGVVVTCSLIPN